MCLHDRYIDTSSVSLYLIFDIHCTRDAKLSPGGIPSSHIEHFAVGGCGGAAALTAEVKHARSRMRRLRREEGRRALSLWQWPPALALITASSRTA